MKETEEELVAMVLSGRVEAFEPLVLPYRQAVLNLAYRILGNREDALEAAQDAFLRAFRYLRRYDPERSFRNWLFQIAANESRDRLRKRGRERRLIEGLGVDPEARISGAAPGPASLRESDEFRACLSVCLEALSPKERAVFVLRDLEEMNIRETAEALGSSAIAVRVHLSAARRKIRAIIREKFPHLEGKP